MKTFLIINTNKVLLWRLKLKPVNVMDVAVIRYIIKLLSYHCLKIVLVEDQTVWKTQHNEHYERTLHSELYTTQF